MSVSNKELKESYNKYPYRPTDVAYDTNNSNELAQQRAIYLDLVSSGYFHIKTVEPLYKGHPLELYNGHTSTVTTLSYTKFGKGVPPYKTTSQIYRIFTHTSTGVFCPKNSSIISNF